MSHRNGCWRKQRAKRCRVLGARVIRLRNASETLGFAWPQSLGPHEIRDARFMARAGGYIVSSCLDALYLEAL